MSPITITSPTADDVSAALKAGQGERVALLSERTSPRKVAETLVAMANASGGMLILDAKIGNNAIGLSEPKHTRELVSAAALMPDPPLLLHQPELVDLDGATVCAVRIPSGLRHVYSLKGQYLIRSGRRNRPLLPNELRRLLLNRNEVGFESQVLEKASLDDLDPTHTAAFHQQLNSVVDLPELLLSHGCLAETTSGLKPTVAGILLFGVEPQRWIRSAEITCVRYPGETMSDDFVRADIRGVLSDQIRSAEAFVSSNMRQGMRIRGLAREDTPEYPISVVREVIVNAVAHRDYSIRGDNIRLLMFSDRLEVYSPGRLPGHVTVDNIVEERYSRNEAIVQVLSESGFIERLGYGIDRIIAVCAQEELPRPQFVETAAGFKVTIYGHGHNLVGAAPPAGLFSHLQLNPRQEKALAFVQENRRITNRDYQQLCENASPETLRRDFADLVDKGVLLKIGERRATYYVLK
ncbi:MAG TPA: transcriptional regulator [Caldilineae bacterium]|nr:transcriptional regulator [Caldilineae bacterium]